MLTATERADLIEQIRTLPHQLREQVAPLTAAELTTHYLPQEWSVAQNVHHLADAHMKAFLDMKRILTEEGPALVPYSPDAWAVTAEAGQAQLSDSLTLLSGLHQRWATLLSGLEEEAWQRHGNHPRAGIRTLDDMLRIYANHGPGHLQQIQQTLAAGRSAAA